MSWVGILHGGAWGVLGRDITVSGCPGRDITVGVSWVGILLWAGVLGRDITVSGCPG